MDSYEYSEMFYDEEVETFYVVQDAFVKFVYPVFILVGLTGNALLAIHLAPLITEVYAHCVYLVMLAVCDSLVLIQRFAIGQWFAMVYRYDVISAVANWSSVTCKLSNFTWTSAQHLQAWLLVSVSVECYVSARRKDANNAQMTSCSRALVLLMLVIIACLNVHFFWTFDRVDLASHDVENRSPNCMPINDRETRSLDVFLSAVSTGVFVFVLPYITIAIVTCLTSLRSCRAHVSRERVAWQRRYLLFVDDIRQVRCCVNVIDIVYLLTLGPFFALWLTICIQKFAQFDVMYAQPRLVEVLQFTGDLGYLIFCSVKFFVCASTCNKFRARVTTMFGSLRR